MSGPGENHQLGFCLAGAALPAAGVALLRAVGAKHLASMLSDPRGGGCHDLHLDPVSFLGPCTVVAAGLVALGFAAARNWARIPSWRLVVVIAVGLGLLASAVDLVFRLRVEEFDRTYCQ